MILKNDNLNTKTPILAMKRCILLVDDDRKRLSLLQGVLSGQYELLSACGADEALSMVSALPNPQDVQLILAQYHLAGDTGQGLQMLDDIKAIVPKAMRMLTSSPDDADALRSLTLGASIDAYLIESPGTEDIEHRVSHEFGVFQAQTKIPAFVLNSNNRICRYDKRILL